MPGYSIDKAARLLEWDLVTQRLSELAASEPGRTICHQLPLLDEPGLIKLTIAEVSEARELLERGVNVQLGGVEELGAIDKRARVGAALEGTDLLRVAGLLKTSRNVRRLLENESSRLPKLAERASTLIEHVVLEKEIFAKIERDGRVKDSASDELAQLRDRYRVVHAQIHATIDGMLKNPRYDDILQEDLFTLRSGRFVLPVKAERRGSVDGIVHDISQTGQSVYIEPREITELNNRLRTAELEIEREIYRILLELTYKVGAIIDELNQVVNELAELDVILAKARYSMALDAQPVEISRGGNIELFKARHPLLDEQIDEVVPNDVQLDDIHTLVVSGPNTGGKTVYLKTIGLCALMLRAGMHLPCGPDGRMPLFKRVFAVIGDEQSIAQNLSSFSSHVLNLKHITDELVPGSLVLIDEIGEGTDPGQGIALAKAIIEYLHEHGARTLVTTHFAELTAMAQTREGYANAAMTFDNETMTPTFHLHPGSPGRSSAFATAERLGLNKQIVQQARAFATGGDTQLDEVIRRLEEQRNKAEAQTRKAEQARLEVEQLREKQQQIYEELRAKKAKLAASDRERIVEETTKARAAIKKVIRKLQEAPSFKAAETAREEINRIQKRVDETLPQPEAGPLPAYLEPIEDWSALPDDAEVYVRSLSDTGRVLEKPDAKGRVRLQVREKRMTLPADDCFIKEQPPASKPGRVERVLRPEVIVADQRESKLEIDLRGQTAEEALANVEDFLDQAMRSRLGQVYVIHGHGTGVLKRTIREYVKDSPYVRSWRPGKRGEGADGVTVVEMDL